MRPIREGYTLLLQRIAAIPFCALGVGFYRVWTEAVYVNSQYAFPAQEIGSFELYNIVIVAVLVILALLAKRIAPLCKIRGIFIITGVLMAASAFMNYISILCPEWGNVLALPAVVCGGIGISFIMMLWSEFYGCINPFRTAIYYSGSIVLGAVVLWIFKGLAFWWLCIGAMTVPFISLYYLKKSLAMLPEDDRPHKSWGSFSFPWKPCLLVALYAFAYGLQESVFTGILGPHSSFGVVVSSILIFFGVVLYPSTFRFAAIWKIALVLMLLSLIPVNVMLPFDQSLDDFLAVSSYNLNLILIMVVLSNLSYRYGVCALWLFSIERAARLLAVTAGTRVSEIVRESSSVYFAETIIGVVVAVLVITATWLVLSEKGLSSSWGVILSESPSNAETLREKNRLGIKCNELAKRFDLSQREEEILLLLAQKKKRSAIESELFIATSTYKTHVRHIYQKLNIHSREDLYQLVGIE